MIYIVDDFIERPILDIVDRYLSDGPFEKQVVGEKDFYVKESPVGFADYVIEKLTDIEKRPLVNILSFFREATDELDVSWRIHSDLNINGQKPDRAIVLYLLSPRERRSAWHRLMGAP